MKQVTSTSTADHHVTIGADFREKVAAADRADRHAAWQAEVAALEEIVADQSARDGGMKAVDPSVLARLDEARTARDASKPPPAAPAMPRDLSLGDGGPTFADLMTMSIDPEGPFGQALRAATPGSTTSSTPKAEPPPVDEMKILVSVRVRDALLDGRIRAGRRWSIAWSDADITAAQFLELQDDAALEVVPVDRVERVKARAAEMRSEAARRQIELDREWAALEVRRVKVNALRAEAEEELRALGMAPNASTNMSSANAPATKTKE